MSAKIKKSRRKGVVGIVYRKNPDVEYLLLRRLDPWKGWEFMKGGLGKDTEEVALERELDEETKLKGLSIQKIPELRVSYRFKGKKDSIYTGQDMQGFLVEVDPRSTVIVNFSEHNDYQWAEYQKAMKLLKHSELKKALKIANRYLTSL